MNVLVKQSPIEEVFNAMTCGVGLCLSTVALAVLVVFAALRGDALKIVSFSIYGASLMGLFLFSMLYHWVKSERAKHVFEILDHCAIYILIAGTYTPFTLVTLRGAWGWSLFGVVWGLTIAGIVFKAFFVKRFKVFSVMVYLFMGWLVVIAFQPLSKNLAMEGIRWLAAGGILFSLGVIFYAFKKMPFHHVIWHVFVIAGCACHFFSIFFYVLPV